MYKRCKYDKKDYLASSVESERSALEGADCSGSTLFTVLDY